MTRRATSPALEALRAGRSPRQPRPWYFDLLRGVGVLLALLGTFAMILPVFALLAHNLGPVLLFIPCLIALGGGLFLWDHFR